MISCTEFIPAYSELFHYLESKNGKAEVRRYWDWLFEPNSKPGSLTYYVQQQGIRGCYTYWSGTLNEEAADFTMYLNEKRGFFLLKMHQCPSKGRLLKLKDEIGLEPHPDYCLHCDGYRAAIESVGLDYIYNFAGQERASCSILVFDPQIFDGQVIMDEDTEIMNRKASENEYFHRAFHNSLNRGVEYVGIRFGDDCVREFLTRFTRNVYRPVIAGVKERGLAALEEKIRDTYHKEKMDDVLTVVRTEDSMKVSVARCPGLAFLHGANCPVSRWYLWTTEVVMEVLANDSGYDFTMESYDEETGRADYRFNKK